MRNKSFPLFAALAAIVLGSLTLRAKAQSDAGPGAVKSPPRGILTPSDAAAILPATVFFRGQSATIQGRNSSGIRLDGGKLVLVTLVDSSGYSSAIQQTYQAYLLSEVPLTLGDKTLPPGAYGFGFTAEQRLVVMDIGANEILHTPTVRDPSMQHPVPLQILADPTSAHSYRLYLGRSYVRLTPS